MPVLAKDGSNYTIDPFPTEGIGLAIIQALTPPPGRPHAGDSSNCGRQVDHCRDQGVVTDAYLYWRDGLSQSFPERIALMSGHTIRQWWVDLEEMPEGLSGDTLNSEIRHYLAEADAASSTLGRPAGVYTAQYWINWFVKAGGDLSLFDGRPIWFVNWNHVPNAADTKYGGNPVAIKQYAGTQPDGTDLDVLSDEEATLLVPAPPTLPGPDPLDPLITALSYVCDDLGDKLLEIQKELSRVREQFIGPRG